MNLKITKKCEVCSLSSNKEDCPICKGTGYVVSVIKNIVKYERISEDECKEYSEDYRKGLEKVE